MTQNDFNKILLSAVNESLCLLGNSSKHAILFHLETSFQLRPENIPSNLIKFQKALEGIFGSGATYLEEIIVNRLNEKLGLKPEDRRNAGFLESVQMAKSRSVPEGEIIVAEETKSTRATLPLPAPRPVGNHGVEVSRHA